MWRINKTLLKNSWIQEEQFKKYFEVFENEDTTFQNLWDAANAGLRGKFIALSAYVRKEERSEINNISFYLRKLEKEEQIKSKVSRIKLDLRGLIIKFTNSS